MTDLSIRVEMGVIPSKIAHDPRDVYRTVAAYGIAEGAAFLAGRLALNTPSGATGKARQAVTHEVEMLVGSVEGHIDYAEPASAYIGFVDQGTRPHWPPVAPIQFWAMRVLGKSDPRTVFGIRRAIATRGTRAQHFVQKTVDENARQAQAIIADAITRKAATL